MHVSVAQLLLLLSSVCIRTTASPQNQHYGNRNVYRNNIFASGYHDSWDPQWRPGALRTSPRSVRQRRPRDRHSRCPLREFADAGQLSSHGEQHHLPRQLQCDAVRGRVERQRVSSVELHLQVRCGPSFTIILAGASSWRSNNTYYSTVLGEWAWSRMQNWSVIAGDLMCVANRPSEGLVLWRLLCSRVQIQSYEPDVRPVAANWAGRARCRGESTLRGPRLGANVQRHPPGFLAGTGSGVPAD